MLKNLLKLVRSDEKIAQALRQTGRTYDLSPEIPLIPANDGARAKTAGNQGPKPKLWLEDWNEQDEKRLKRNDHHWEGYIS